MKLPEILIENDAFIVLNKPAGLLSVPDRTQSAPSLKDLLIEKYQQIFTVHRLDRETSGVIVFAKTAELHQYLSVIFQERQVEKQYYGIVWGVPASPKESLNSNAGTSGKKWDDGRAPKRKTCIYRI